MKIAIGKLLVSGTLAFGLGNTALATEADRGPLAGEGNLDHQSMTDFPSFTEVDLDGDGRISRAEAQAFPAVAAGFDRADRDGDGQLSDEEYAAMKSDGRDP